jgi:putative ABC transport system ATP-binding protein
LVHNPAVVLADEPTAALDTERAHQVVQTFANLIHEQERAGIMVTHDLRMVQYADRVVQMMDGRVAHEYTERAEINALSSEGKIENPAVRLKATALKNNNQGEFVPQPALAM